MRLLFDAPWKIAVAAPLQLILPKLRPSTPCLGIVDSPTPPTLSVLSTQVRSLLLSQLSPLGSLTLRTTLQLGAMRNLTYSGS